MSTALSSFTLRQTRPKQSDAGVGATMAYNQIIRDVLPPIVAELEKKIADLEAKIQTGSGHRRTRRRTLG